MHNVVNITINGHAFHIENGTTVAAAMMQAAVPCRTSVTGEPRTAVCGMGVCFECRAMVNGVAYQRTCQMPCTDGMVVETQQ